MIKMIDKENKNNIIHIFKNIAPETMVGDSFLKWLMDSLAGA